MRRFRIDVARECVAQAVLFDDGTVALRTLKRWLKEDNTRTTAASTQLYSSLAFMRLSYPDASLRWEDKCCFACSAPAERPTGPGGCLSCGSTWDSPADEVEPSGGRWVLAGEIKAEHVP